MMRVPREDAADSWGEFCYTLDSCRSSWFALFAF